MDNYEKKARTVSVKRKSESTTACCCNEDEIKPAMHEPREKWISGQIETVIGMVPITTSELDTADTIGTWKVRWGIERMNYRIEPGIYAVGAPDQASPVLVSANYKLSFDALRKELSGLSAWILVLDTKGINVWCAAGKGTFGTKELVNRISKTKLSSIVMHKTLILPQLGAPGVSAHLVTKATGFHIVYGPVRAADIKEFLEKGMKATEEMRAVRFNMMDRLVLTPVELVNTFKVSLYVFGVLFLLNLMAAKLFGIVDFVAFEGALVTGCVLTPLLLPFIPGKAFSWKGWLLGLIWTTVVILVCGGIGSSSLGYLKEIGYLLVLPSVSAYYAMNFTGSSTYTSFSGVMKEMKKAVPIIAVTIVSEVLLLLVDSLIRW